MLAILLCYCHTVLLSWDCLCLCAMVSIKRLLEVLPLTFLSPTRFSTCFFVVLQEMLDHPSFAVIRLFEKDNVFSKKINFYFQLFAGRFWFCFFVYMFFTAFFFTVLLLWNYDSETAVVFWVSEVTKFEVDTISISLRY